MSILISSGNNFIFITFDIKIWWEIKKIKYFVINLIFYNFQHKNFNNDYIFINNKKFI
jgi:hypothetical protein